MNTAIKVTILVTNAVLALVLVYVFATGKCTWDQLLVGFGLLITPSAGGLAMMRANGKSNPPPPNASSVLLVCALASALAACGVGLSGCALLRARELDVKVIAAPRDGGVDGAVP